MEVKYPSGGTSMGVSKDSKLVVTASGFSIYSVDGDLLHSFADDEFSDFSSLPRSMATWGEHEFYGINRSLVKYDVSPETMKKIKEGTWKAQLLPTESVAEVTPETTVERTTATEGGVLCECVREEESGKLRIRVISPGYNNSWTVQFPRDIREESAKYVVQQIVEEEGFYRAWGDIKRVEG